MRLEHYPEEKLKKEILEIIGKYLDINECAVFFFGSRVDGRGDESSDIDIGIEGDKPMPGHILEKIREEIENLPVLYSFDVVDFSRMPEKFKETASLKEYIDREKIRV